MRVALASVGSHIHDTARPARVAFMDLLLKVKNIRGIRYFDVAPSEHILERFALDARVGSVA
jgi:condensin-2 complex subunit G2